MELKFDARFTAFLLLGKMIDKMFPDLKHFNQVQGDAMHEYADIIARELLSGNYVYTPRDSNKNESN